MNINEKLNGTKKDGNFLMEIDKILNSTKKISNVGQENMILRKLNIDKNIDKNVQIINAYKFINILDFDELLIGLGS